MSKAIDLHGASDEIPLEAALAALGVNVSDLRAVSAWLRYGGEVKS